MNEREDELQRILQGNSTEADDTKQFEMITIDLLKSDKMASENDLNQINFSTLIAANDLR